jgi:hypothetical protein
LRDELLHEAETPLQSQRLAMVFESEARAWSQLYELSSVRLVWRAALGAEAGARANAALWAQRAATVAAAPATSGGQLPHRLIYSAAPLS